jgi:hypothetical protein
MLSEFWYSFLAVFFSSIVIRMSVDTSSFREKVSRNLLCPHYTSQFNILSTLYLKITYFAQCQWLTLVILVTQEAEIRMISVQSQPRQIVL